MTREYQSLLNKGKLQYTANGKFIALLAKRKIGGFDDRVHEIHDEVFGRIDCTKCANCCRVLGPRLNQTDINRFAKELRVKRSSFIGTYLKRDEDDDFVFKSMPCPFIGADDLCTVYDSRPRACINYPHTNEKNMHSKMHRLLTNTLYCPAALLVLERLKELHKAGEI